LLLLSCTPSREGKQALILTDGARSVTVWVEVADEPSEQRRGLQARAQLPQDQGMLFVFTFPQPLSFWMRETIIPLDVLFFDEAGSFVGFRTMEPCRREPCPIYSSNGPAKYALEVNAGFVEREGIGDGWRLQLE
jgi:uncharacterized membrane protein (UPF0127 family)